MRILDKNTDFYDYLQNVYRDTSVTFDRTDSFMLTKDIVLDKLRVDQWHRLAKYYSVKFILLQVCNTLWLIAVRYTVSDTGHERVIDDYSVELLRTWKNYNKDRCLIKLNLIHFKRCTYHQRIVKFLESDNIDSDPAFQKFVDKLVYAVDHNEYDISNRLDRHTVFYGKEKKEKHIPILRDSKLASCIVPIDIYLSLEEYFSLEKQSNERSESIGLTDIEKVENHGFDKKNSFRGKN